MESRRSGSEGDDGKQQEWQHQHVPPASALLHPVSQNPNPNPLTRISVTSAFGHPPPGFHPPNQPAVPAYHFQQLTRAPSQAAMVPTRLQPNAFTGWVSPAYREGAAIPAPAGPFQLPSSTGHCDYTAMAPQRVLAMTPSFSKRYLQGSTPVLQEPHPPGLHATSTSSQPSRQSLECETSPNPSQQPRLKPRDQGAKTLPNFKPSRSDSVLGSSPPAGSVPRPSLRKTLPATAANEKPAVRRLIEPDSESSPSQKLRRSDATPKDSSTRSKKFRQTGERHTVGASAANADLNSAEETKTPKFIFCSPAKHESDIHIFKCPKPVDLCIRSKRFLVNKYSNNPEIAQDFLRIDSQDLHDIDPDQVTYAVLLTNATHIKGLPETPIAILTLFIKGDKNLRTFYMAFKLQPWLDELADTGCITEIVASFKPRTVKHDRLFIFLRQTFEDAMNIPHHPDYLRCEQMTDWSAPIMNPQDALQRLEKHEQYYTHRKAAKGPELDLEDDRYLVDLHPAERIIAADVKIRCSKYLLIKRQFFKAFWDEMVKQKEKIGDGRKRVRTEAAHETWLQTEYAWKVARVRTLVNGWKVLGLLDERRYLEHLNAGGVFESEDVEDNQEVEGDVAEN